MEAYAKGTREALKFLENRIRLTKMRDWVYALDDEFQVRFKDIASNTSFDVNYFSDVAKFSVIIDDVSVIEDDLLPWFKTRDFKCVSIKDNEGFSWSSDSPTKDYTLRRRQGVTDKEAEITKECSTYGWSYQEGEPWEVVLKVGFSGEGCAWVEVGTGEYHEIPAVPATPAEPARREEITVKELRCN